MHTIHTIDKLDSTHEGPTAEHESGSFEHVFLNQGSLDGACGHYCVFMSLIINGILTRSDALTALSYRQDGRTNLGKLASKVKDLNFFHGTVDSDIENIFEDIYRRQIKAEKFSKPGKLKDFIIKNIENNNPVMLGISWSQNSGHWVIVVGLDYAGNGDTKELYRFLVIDPGGNDMQFCSWNGVIQAQGSGGQYSYEWWGTDRKVKLEDAVAIKVL